jgi:hypothetical protein
MTYRVFLSDTPRRSRMQSGDIDSRFSTQHGPSKIVGRVAELESEGKRQSFLKNPGYAVASWVRETRISEYSSWSAEKEREGRGLRQS